MARAAELSDLVRNESKRLTEKKQMHQNLQQKDISRASTLNPLALFDFLLGFTAWFMSCCCPWVCEMG